MLCDTDPEEFQRLAARIDRDYDDEPIAPYQEKADVDCPAKIEETPIEHHNRRLGEADGRCINHHVRKKDLAQFNVTRKAYRG